MANYVENKEMSNSKVKACMKQEIMDYIEQCVIERYGDARVSYVRNGNGDSKTKELAVVIGNVEYNGEEYEGVVCINASAKDYRERVSDKGKVYSPYEFNIMRELYEQYLEEKALKEKDSKTQKEKKIAADNATRAKAKAKAEEDTIDF